MSDPAHAGESSQKSDSHKSDSQKSDSHKSDKRKAIIEAARARFRHYGIGKTTMQDIAEDVGIAVGTLYLYFKNKDDLVLGCAERFADLHREAAAKLLSSNLPADEKLREYILDRYRAVEETRTGSKHAVEIARRVIKLRPQRFEEDDQWLYENVLAILFEGVNQGIFAIKEPERDTRIFVQAVLYFLPVAGMEPYRLPTEKSLLEVVQWFTDKWRA